VSSEPFAVGTIIEFPVPGGFCYVQVIANVPRVTTWVRAVNGPQPTRLGSRDLAELVAAEHADRRAATFLRAVASARSNFRSRELLPVPDHLLGDQSWRNPRPALAGGRQRWQIFRDGDSYIVEEPLTEDDQKLPNGAHLSVDQLLPLFGLEPPGTAAMPRGTGAVGPLRDLTFAFPNLRASETFGQDVRDRIWDITVSLQPREDPVADGKARLAILISDFETTALARQTEDSLGDLARRHGGHIESAGFEL
jgi:hypothetical protein